MSPAEYTKNESYILPNIIISEEDYNRLGSFPRSQLILEYTEKIDVDCSCDSKIIFGLPCYHSIQLKKSLGVTPNFSTADYRPRWLISQEKKRNHHHFKLSPVLKNLLHMITVIFTVNLMNFSQLRTKIRKFRKY